MFFRFKNQDKQTIDNLRREITHLNEIIEMKNNLTDSLREDINTHKNRIEELEDHLSMKDREIHSLKNKHIKYNDACAGEPLFSKE